MTHLTNQYTRIAKQRLIEIGWVCGDALPLKVVLLARNRLISSVRRQHTEMLSSAPMNDWMQLVLNSVITGVLLYAVQTIFDERASKRLAEFKTRFGKLHERQAEVIAELYKGLVQIQSSLNSFAHVIDSEILSHTKGEKEKEAKEYVDAFWDYFQKHRIYLPESLGKRIEEFYRQSMLAYINLLSADISQELSSDDESYQKKYAKEQAKAAGILADGISPVRDDIALEFRELLGNRTIDNSTPSKPWWQIWKSSK